MTHSGYNSTLRGRNHNYGFLDIEYAESLDLNLYEMVFRQYDPTIGRFMSIDAYAESFSDITTYHYSNNNPIMFSDPTGLFPVNHASVVVDRSGTVIDYRDDDDPNIYLDYRGGTVVGQEEEGKEYKKGDKIYDVDDQIDTFFELQVETVEVREELDALAKKKQENTKHLENILKKVKRGHPLSTTDVQLLSSLLQEGNSIGHSLTWNQHKAKKLAQLFEAYQDEIPWDEVGLNGANTTINHLSNLLKLVQFWKSVEIPDGTGKTIKSKTKTSLKKDLGLKPSDVRRTHQQLPYTLDYYDY